VLVTGATGFLGAALVPALLGAGHRPRVFARRPQPAREGVEAALGDLGDERALLAAAEGAEAVVHLGAATSAGRVDPAEAFRVNVGGASALLSACRAVGCRRIVAVSTQHVHLARPGVYGRSKRIADALFAGSGLDVTILRPSLIYGPGERGVFVKLRRLVRKLPLIPVLGPGTWRLRPLFLPDFVAIVLETLRRPDLAGRSYDLGGPDLVSYNAFLEAICRAQGRPCRRVHLPLAVGFALAWTLERALANPPLTVENVHGARVEAPCDLRALLRDLRPTLTPLAAGLPQSLREAA
jgi:NADH dehydrogenase